MESVLFNLLDFYIKFKCILLAAERIFCEQELWKPFVKNIYRIHPLNIEPSLWNHPLIMCFAVAQSVSMCLCVSVSPTTEKRRGGLGIFKKGRIQKSYNLHILIKQRLLITCSCANSFLYFKEYICK